nr:MAG TPA: hypothetical protein [Caudoviricetes sp.]
MGISFHIISFFISFPFCYSSLYININKFEKIINRR